MISISRIHSLLEKVTSQQATPEECEELLQLLESTGQDKAIDQMDAYFGANRSSVDSMAETDKKFWKSAAQEIIQIKSNGSYTTPVYSMYRQNGRFWVAASIIFLLVLIGGAYWRISSEKFSLVDDRTNNYSFVDIQPGEERATLTLADGKKIVLDDTQNGDLAQQGNTRVVKLDKGQLVYESGTGSSEKIVFNTLSVPRGGQYALTLSDGSKVWLNAASSIKYPTAFTGSERVVEISGEVYMEIEKNTKQPFKVKANGTEIVVLGTSFNINAYSDESSVKTTVIDGSVKVIKSSTGGSVVLSAGKQAEVADATEEVKVETVDTEQILAWRNGLFSFNNADVKTIMRQLSRWYDINIVYEKGVPTQRFYGEMNRNLALSQVLKGLEVIKVKFKLEGRNLIVIP